VKVLFFLGGGSRRSPIGGHKIVYEYANYLADELGVNVEIFHSASFFNHQNVLLGRLGWLSMRTKAAFRLLALRLLRQDVRPSWFNLSERVKFTDSIRLPAPAVDRNDILVATATQTAPFVEALAHKTGSNGTYFIQHYETWSAPKRFVDDTWRLPLQKIVIAPWLASIGDSLGVATTLVSNAVDATDFPPGPDLERREPLVLAMVSPIEFKRTDLIISLYRKLAEENPSTKLITFGVCDRPEGLPLNVEHFQRPSRSELSALYRRAQVYVCASNAEGWHLPPSEALISGSMVVSTDIGGVRSYANHVALFSPVGSLDGLLKNVNSVLQDPAEFQGRVERGQDRLRLYRPEDAARAFANAIGVTPRTTLKGGE